MTSYYQNKLSGERLLRCYDIANARMRQYFDAEIQFLVDNVRGFRTVLELGCGYGRVMERLSPFVSKIVGIDISMESLELAQSYLERRPNCALSRMDACKMGIGTGIADAVYCIQNGLSAFQVDKKQLIAEAHRVTKNGGLLLFSSYSPKIWEGRLEWFRRQSQEGLIGEIDDQRTANGTIVCKDGFRTSTVEGVEFIDLFSRVGMRPSIVEVDQSSVFCRATKAESHG